MGKLNLVGSEQHRVEIDIKMAAFCHQIRRPSLGYCCCFTTHEGLCVPPFSLQSSEKPLVRIEVELGINLRARTRAASTHSSRGWWNACATVSAAATGRLRCADPPVLRGAHRDGEPRKVCQARHTVRNTHSGQDPFQRCPQPKNFLKRSCNLILTFSFSMS